MALPMETGASQGRTHVQVLVKEALQLSARLRLPSSIPNHEVCQTASKAPLSSLVMHLSAIWAAFALVKAMVCHRHQAACKVFQLFAFLATAELALFDMLFLTIINGMCLVYCLSRTDTTTRARVLHRCEI